MTFIKTHALARPPREVAPKLALGLVAATLVLTSALPAIANDPSPKEQPIAAEAKGGGKRGKNGKKTRTVTRTFSNGGNTIAIPAKDAVDEFGTADPYPSAVRVSGFKRARITDLNLTLHGFSHDFPDDVDFLLVAPNGRNAVVMGDVGLVSNGNDDDNIVENLTLTLDDEAPTPLPATERLSSGTFQPLDVSGLNDTDNPNLAAFPAPAPAPSGETALATFDGINPNGEWRLFVIDDFADDTGDLAGGWSLRITAKTKGKKKR